MIGRLTLVASVMLISCGRSDPAPEQPLEVAAPQPSAAAVPSEPTPQPLAERTAVPPPPDPNAWLRKVEKDPIEALKTLDPGALQPKRTGRTPQQQAPQIRPESRPGPAIAKYDATKPLRGWPPVVGRPYPEIALIDQTGRVTSLSELRGKVVLVELVGMTCSACHAFSGANEASPGRFRSIAPQKGLGSIEQYAKQFGKLSLDHPDIVFVQLLLYGMDGQTPPTLQDIQAWARHFGMDRYRNEIVLLGDMRFISMETRRMIPGFHLIDRNGILRAFHSNLPGGDNLYTSLLPTMGRLASTR